MYITVHEDFCICQDDPMEGCGDGEWNGHRYFTCPPGRAFFCPVANIGPDSRVPLGGNSGVNRV